MKIQFASLSVLALLTFGVVAREASAADIYVTTTEWRVGAGPGCSLQEAIYAANFQASISINGLNADHTDNFVPTNCVPGDGNDTIILPVKAVFQMNQIVDDAYNPFGPTATPIIFSNVTVEANGSTLQGPTQSVFGHPATTRAFAVGSANVNYAAHVYSGTGQLTIKDAYIRGFTAKGGDGGKGGGGGGLGAGGAIYVKDGTLIIENSTFASNQGVGGHGYTILAQLGGGGGGGGLSGNGGSGAPDFYPPDGSDHTKEGAGGGGGSRGNGGDGGARVLFGGGGGGTVVGGDSPDLPMESAHLGGFNCGGNGGNISTDTASGSGGDGSCAGGGGGGGGAPDPVGDLLGITGGSGTGAKGNYGGGGGGGAGDNGDGGDGGFGGGGGGGASPELGVCVTGFDHGWHGGNGGFGGGGGTGFRCTAQGDPGKGGSFGGNASETAGGGGGALGGAIFNDGGVVKILNSTFTGNLVYRGDGGDSSTDIGAAAGGAIFSLNGSLTISDSTISSNLSTEQRAGVVVYQEGNTSTSFTLLNTIIANNGLAECAVLANSVTSSGFAGNLVENNDPNNACQLSGSSSGVVSNADPQLGPLQDNGGLTPTMAIPPTSPAYDAAEPATSLDSDQRSFPRPSLDGHGFDIGAFELCTPTRPEISLYPCIVVGNAQTAQLTMQVSPAAGGTTSPSVGANTEPGNSVILVTAMPNTGYCFVNWSANVTIPTSSSSTIILKQDQVATANFLLSDFSLSPISPITVAVGSAVTTNGVKVNSVTCNFNSAVGLSASGQPAGMTVSFNSATVTPPGGASAASQMTVTLGPSVTPGTYTFMLIGTSGALTHSTPVTVTVTATASGIESVVSQDQLLNCINNSGIAQALTAKLDQSEANIAAGQIQAAINTETALLNQVQAQTGKHIATSCMDIAGNQFNAAQALTIDVQMLLANLKITGGTDPIMGYVADGSGRGVSGSTVSLLDAGNNVLATASTDVTGFYFFSQTMSLISGATCFIKVTTIPNPYTTTTPAAQAFTWSTSQVMLGFVLK